MSNIYNQTPTNYTSPAGSSNLTAFFDSRAHAETAVSRLEDAGIPTARIRLVPGYEANGSAVGVRSDDRVGFFDALANFFFPDEDRELYSEGLRRGGFLVSVSDIDDANYETVHDILDEEGSIDIDERADLWRTEGWNQGGSNTGYAGAANDGKAADDLAVAEDDFHTADATPVRGERDLMQGSNKVRAYTYRDDVRPLGDSGASQSQSQGSFGQRQGFRKN